MSDDDRDLRARIARIDPARRLAAADLVQALTVEQIRERTMQTIDTTPTTSTVRPRWRRPALVLGAAASVAAVVVAVALTTRGGTTPKRDTAVTTLTLRAPAGGPVMSSCIPFGVAILRDMPVAFAGTVTTVGADSVTLDVDRWYRGGTADRITVTNPSSGTPVSIEGVEFSQGGRYLVTATDGTVNACGYSGPATADLEKAYGEAFPGQ